MSERITGDFNPSFLKAKFDLGLLPPEKLPTLAIQALELDFDGKATRIIAGLVNPTFRDLESYLTQFWLELNAVDLTPAEVTRLVVNQVATQIISQPESSLKIVRRLWPIWSDLGHCQEFWIFLEVEEYAGTYFTEKEAEDRLLVLSKCLIANLPSPEWEIYSRMNEIPVQSKSKNVFRRILDWLGT